MPAATSGGASTRMVTTIVARVAAMSGIRAWPRDPPLLPLPPPHSPVAVIRVRSMCGGMMMMLMMIGNDHVLARSWHPFVFPVLCFRAVVLS